MNLRRASKVFKLLDEMDWEIKSGHTCVDLPDYTYIACPKKSYFNIVEKGKFGHSFRTKGLPGCTLCAIYPHGKDENEIIDELAKFFIRRFAESLDMTLDI